MADPTGAEADFSHYFTDPGDRRPRRPRPVEVVVDGHRRTLTSEAGVFAHGALDEGTALLISRGAVSDPGATSLADLGCGWGPLTVALALRAPRARVWALDTNPRAVELCARNATACGLDNVTAHPVEADPPLGGLDPGVTFDAVWSNPPVRIGKQALHLLLTAALERLRPGGTAHLVVHKHLGSDSLQRWLGSQGHPTTRRLSRGGYRLLDVGPVGT
jgi:16S rRNA (guanine1207-N2)-methyltransferase